MINWKTNFEIPPDGSRVVVMSWHWKERFPGSMEIMGGEVCYLSGRLWCVDTMDESGKGGFSKLSEDIEFWCFAEDFLQAMPERIRKGETEPGPSMVKSS